MRTKIYIYSLLAIVFSIMAIGFYTGTMQSITGSTAKVIAIGRWMGIVMAFSILIELLLMARIPAIENNFDVDDISQVHRWNGYVLVYSIVAHVVFLTVGYAWQQDNGLIGQFIALNTDFEDVLLATFGSILFFVIAISSVKIARKAVRYETWYYLHLIAYIAVGLTFLHQINSGSDLITQDWLRWYWIAIYAVLFALLGYYRFIRQLVYMFRFGFSVSSVQQEAKDIYSVYITGKGLGRLKFQAGQYATWRFLAKGYWGQAHPFSISSPPGAAMLRLTFKAKSGDFSQSLMSVPIGARVLLDGPRGAFTTSRGRCDNVLLLAGGIGVAPMVAMLAQLATQHKKVALIYCVRQRLELAFAADIRHLQQIYPNITCVVHESSTAGRLTVPQALRYVDNDLLGTSVLLCGPSGMADCLKTDLVAQGVPAHHIIAEQFKF